MSFKHELIDVRVSQRILWFGSEAYPLHNITRTNTLKLEPNRTVAIRKFVKAVVLGLILATVVAAFVPPVVAVLVIVGVLVWIGVKTVKLIQFLRLTLYELLIETAAGSHRGLISDDSKVVEELGLRITDAINNPLAEFQMRVENFHVGDNISMFGDQNVGKVAR